MSCLSFGTRFSRRVQQGSVIVISLIFLGLVGCATSGDVTELGSRLDAIDQRLAGLSAKMDATQTRIADVEVTAGNAMRRAEQAEANAGSAAANADAAATKAAAAFAKTVRK